MPGRGAQEGYLLIDNRASGILPPANPGHPEIVTPDRLLFETATYTCNHCNAIVVKHPERTRPRDWCSGCDHIICGGCAFLARTQGCVPMAKRLEDGQTAAERALIRAKE